MNKNFIAICAVAGLLAGCSATPQFENSKDMEDVVGMELPSYKMKKYIEDSSMDIHGDYDDSLIVEFDCLPSKAFIEKVNNMVEQDSGKTEKRWLKEDEHRYRFQASYGDGGRVRKCREGRSDWHISMDFSDNSKSAVIVYGYW